MPAQVSGERAASEPSVAHADTSMKHLTPLAAMVVVSAASQSSRTSSRLVAQTASAALIRSNLRETCLMCNG